MGGETSEAGGQALQEHYSQGCAEDNGLNAGWRRGGWWGWQNSLNSHCMLVPIGLNFKLQKLVTTISMILIVFSGPTACLIKTLNKETRQFYVE